MDEKIFDNPKIRDSIETLQKLNLTKHEAVVYVCLLSLGREIGSSKIIKASGLHGQFVYDALDVLEKRGLVGHVVSSGRKKFTARPPGTLAILAEEQKVLAYGVSSTLEDELLREHVQEEIELYQDEASAIAQTLRAIEEIPDKSEMCIIGGDGDHFAKFVGQRFSEYERTRLKKRVSIRYIGSVAEKNHLSATGAEREHFEFRLLPTTFKGRIETHIIGSTILFWLFGEKETLFHVKNSQLAQEYRLLFDSIWELSSKEV